MMLSYAQPAPPPPPFHERCAVIDGAAVGRRLCRLEARGDYALAHELRAALQTAFGPPEVKPPGPVLTVVCAWCQTVQGTKACAPEQAGLRSDTVCPACLAQLKAQLKAQQLKPEGPS